MNKDYNKATHPEISEPEKERRSQKLPEKKKKKVTQIQVQKKGRMEANLRGNNKASNPCFPNLHSNSGSKEIHIIRDISISNLDFYTQPKYNKARG